MKAVILVGGQGTRLRPLTLEGKKELMPVANRPFLEHVLANLSRHDIDEVILTTGHLAEAFADYPEERKHGVVLTTVKEETALGTCGAVKNVEHLLDDTFLVLNGDILTDLDISAVVDFHRRRGAVGTLTLTRVSDPSAYGLVPIDNEGRIRRFIEKPTADEVVTDLINAGTYVLEPEVLKRAPAGEPYMFERGLFPSLLADHEPLYGFPSSAYWLDIGTPEKYLRANVDAVERRVGEEPPGTQDGAGVWRAQDVVVAPSAQVRGPAVLGTGTRVGEEASVHPLSCVGDRCLISPRATVDESVLHDDVVIAEGASVRRSVIGRGARIGEGTRLEDAVVGPTVVVGRDNELRGGIRLFPGLDVPDRSLRFSG